MSAPLASAANATRREPLIQGRMRLLYLPVAAALVVLAWRLIGGLGPTTGLNDGYPWGLWIAYDVVTGTALACGGYAIAIVVYVLNRGRYHPLVRPAILSSALGYSIAGLSIFIDVGRYWNIWKVLAFPWQWNFNSVLLEVALCIMAYVMVLWIELTPAFFEGWKSSPRPWLKAFAEWAHPRMEKALLWIIALGLLLPTMHQSSLGSLMLIAGPKLNPLWHTPLLPLLFLLGCLGMGYAVVIFETTAYAFTWKIPRKRRLLQGLGKAMVPVCLLWIAVRLGDLAWRGRLDQAFDHGWRSGMFLLELLLFLLPALLLMWRDLRANPGARLLAAFLLMIGGALYRFDVYLTAYDPGPGWTYFPTVPELLVSVGFVCIEILVFVAVVRAFPVLGGGMFRSQREPGRAT